MAPEPYAPADSPDRAEQRIVEQAERLDGRGAVSSWASLRVQGAAYFDGSAPGVPNALPVALLSPRHLAATASSTSSRSWIPTTRSSWSTGSGARGSSALSDDVTRADRFGAHHIETFTIVAGDSVATQVARMRAAHDRARRPGDDRRTWTIVPPPEAWVPPTVPLDDELDRTDPWPPGFA